MVHFAKQIFNKMEGEDKEAIELLDLTLYLVEPTIKADVKGNAIDDWY